MAGPTITLPTSAVMHNPPKYKPTTEDAVFFAEGPGFLLVEIIAAGTMSNTMVVRSVIDGKLYIRKEVPSKIIGSQEIEDDDVRNGLIVIQIPNTTRLVGWARYVDVVHNETYTASYWNFCNAGSLEAYEDEMTVDVGTIPERFIWKFFAEALKILLDCHAAGIAHNDAFPGNWFLHYDNENSTDFRIVLGDFGMSSMQQEYPPAQVSATTTLGQQARTPWMLVTRHDIDSLCQTLVRYICTNRIAHDGRGFSGPIRAFRRAVYDRTIQHISQSLLDLVCELDDIYSDGHLEESSWTAKLNDLLGRVGAEWQRLQHSPSEPEPSALHSHRPHHMLIEEFKWTLVGVQDWDVKNVRNWWIANVEHSDGHISLIPPENRQTNWTLSSKTELMPNDWLQYHSRWLSNPNLTWSSL